MPLLSDHVDVLSPLTWHMMLCIAFTDVPDEAQAETSCGEFLTLAAAVGFHHDFNHSTIDPLASACWSLDAAKIGVCLE